LKYKGVADGTRNGEVLCRTCSYAKIIAGRAEGQELTFCTYNDKDEKVPFEVIECTKYDDKRLPGLYELKKIAWVINADGAKNKAGFVKPGSAEHSKLTDL
jgi:hypothetical protein